LECAARLGDEGVEASGRALPLRIGDVGLLPDPGRHRILAGFTALDVDPRPLITTTS
jgi:selenocysteine-specific elongation factor